MKRKNLFLSLISSVLVAVAIVTVTICSVIKPKNNTNNNVPIVTPTGDDSKNDKDYNLINELERNGSEEYPYIIYSVDSYNTLLSKFGAEDRIITKPKTKKVEENGEVKDIIELDENGHMIFEEVLDEDGNKTYGVYNFELVNDIDFAGNTYKTLFNNGKAMKANINGNGYALKNISIDVTKDNFESDFSYSKEGIRVSHIALFGDVNGSKFVKLNISGLKINVEKEVYAKLKTADYNLALGAYRELTVGSIAGISTDMTLDNVNVDAVINAFAYSENYENKGYNAIGGVSAVVNNLTMTNSKVNVEINAIAGYGYNIAGVAAYAFGANVNASEINAKVNASMSISYLNEKSYICGMFYGAVKVNANDVKINLDVKQNDEQSVRDAFLANKKATPNTDSVTYIAGIVGVLDANNSTVPSALTNVTVNSNVDFDGIFAGAIVDVFSSNKTTYSLVKLTDVKVYSNVNALAIHGFARQLVATTVDYTEDMTAEGYCNIRIIGKAKLNRYFVGSNEYVAETMFVAIKEGYKYIDVNYNDLYVEVSTEADAMLLNSADKQVITFSRNKAAGQTEATIPGSDLTFKLLGKYVVIG